MLSPRQRGCLGPLPGKDAAVGLGIGFQPVERSDPFVAVETDASIPTAWPQCLAIFGTRTIIEASSDQLSGDAGRQPAGGNGRGGPARDLLCSLVAKDGQGQAGALTRYETMVPTITRLER